MIPRRAAVLVPLSVVCLLIPHNVQSQTALGDIWRTVRKVLLPEYVSGTYELRTFIATQPPMQYSREAHLARLNRIWNYAVYLSEGDIQTALFISTIATIPYHTFPAYVPLLGFGVTVPVSTESRAAFEKRYENLPALLYENSPGGGDRDKLPHFFGAAFIQYRGRSPLLSAFAGESIEIAEKFFKLEGAYDARDIDVNYRGIAFAQTLRNGKDALPSEYFNEVLPGTDHEHTK